MPALHTLQLLGLAGIASYAAARLLRRYDVFDWHRASLLAIPVDALPPMPRGYSVAPIAPAILAAHAIDIPMADQAARFAKGAICLAAWTDRKELAGVTWLARGGYDEDDLHVRYVLPDDAAWDTGLWIAPEHRMGRAFPALWAGTAAWLRAQGLTRTFSKIYDYNHASLRAHKRMNPQMLGHFALLRVGRQQWATRGTPRWSRIDGSRTVIDLRDALPPVAKAR